MNLFSRKKIQKKKTKEEKDRSRRTENKALPDSGIYARDEEDEQNRGEKSQCRRPEGGPESHSRTYHTKGQMRQERPERNREAAHNILSKIHVALRAKIL